MKFFAATSLSLLISSAHTFTAPRPSTVKRSVSLYAAEGEEKAVAMVSGEDLELLLQNMEQPLVVDAYATWWYVTKERRLQRNRQASTIRIANAHFLVLVFRPHSAQENDILSQFSLFRPHSGPCLLMAPEFEQAAQELKGKVKFVKLDTDQEEEMASRLNIMGLPTLLFLDKYQDDENPDARAVLKGRIEGAMQKKSILDLVEHYFFDGPAPQLF
jgi:thiol-disulfide isomerase/thioredoxin